MKKILLIIAGVVLFGCEMQSPGQMATIYHDGRIETETQCNLMVQIKQNPDLFEVRVLAHDITTESLKIEVERYSYKNDLMYRAEVKPCFY